jgi:hypothetical protein
MSMLMTAPVPYLQAAFWDRRWEIHQARASGTGPSPTTWTWPASSARSPAQPTVLADALAQLLTDLHP